jgi:sugar/nucleoside kinase (ribokinase family)
VTPVAVVGSLSRDVVAGAPARAGGAVYFGARALARIGAEARVVARCGASDSDLLLPPLLALGLPVTSRLGARSPAFTFHYEADRRVMRVDEIGDPWTTEDIEGWVENAIADARWIQVGALLRSDFEAPVLALLARRRRHLLLDAQGLVRIAALGPLRRDARVDRDVYTPLTVLKLNEGEANLLAGAVEPHRLRALGVPEVVVTLGPAGALVVTDSAAERIPPLPAEGVVDPTGAGDAFAAAYAHARAAGATPVEAGRTANAVAAALVADEGES